MLSILDKVELYIDKTQVGESIKWTELYNTEDELIADMTHTSVNVKGYEFIDRYKKKVSQGEELSSKEITQLKRLAKYVFSDINKL